MNTAREIGGSEEKRAREESKRAEMRFIWIPGKIPVIVPARIPRMRARSTNSSMIIYVSLKLYF
jgi:hypothetical protein